jgi:hypothetical protein
LKGSSATSAKATAGSSPRPIARSSGRRRSSPTSADEVALTGPSNPPDLQFNAYRKDLADVALIDCVIASHYAEPVERRIASAASLRIAPSDEANAIRDLEPGEPFAMLDESVGWAWGYAGKERRVGYVRSGALES